MYRFVARHSLFIGPGGGFVAAAWILDRMQAPWMAWVALVASMAILWTLPVWRRQKASAFASAEDLGQRLGGGRPSILHFYSDF